MLPEPIARQLVRKARAELAQLRRIRGAYRRTARRIARAQAQLAFATALLAACLGEPALAGTPRFDNGVFGLVANADASSSPSFADLDGDGDLDGLVGQRAGQISFFENVGTTAAPTFAAPAVNPFGLVDVGYNATPEFVDIDGDGDLDAFTGERLGNLLYFRNTGTETAPAFAAPLTNAFGLADVGDRSVPTFADLDGDGDLDIYIGNAVGNTLFFRNTGTPGAPVFAAPVTNPFGLADVGTEASPDFADTDGDGDLDAFIGNTDGDMLFFRNNGTTIAPAFAAPVVNPSGLENVPYNASPSFTDIDGDGDLDVFVGEFFGATTFFRNLGTPAVADFVVGVTNPLRTEDVGFTSAPDLADIDDDGDLDVFAGNTQGDTLFYRNLGTPEAPVFAYLAPLTSPFGLTDVGFAATPHFADINGDGDLDAFVGNLQGVTRYYANTGSASAPAFAAPVASPFGLTDVGLAAAPHLADLDADGDLDAFIGNEDGNTLFFRNTGSAGAPAFAAPLTNPFGLVDVGLDASPAFADVDGDGDLDAFVSENAGSTFFFRNTGSPSAPAFAAPQADPFGLANVGGFASAAFGDLDTDADLDAAIGEEEGRIFYFENGELDAEACTDGLDNDGDGAIDLGGDPGCASASDKSELGVAQCDNGIDDDFDAKIDWRASGGDLQCTSLTDNSEAGDPGPPGCGIGPELLVAIPLLAGLRRRRKG